MCEPLRPLSSLICGSTPLFCLGHDSVSDVRFFSFFWGGGKQLLSLGRVDRDVGHRRHFEKN